MNERDECSATPASSRAWRAAAQECVEEPKQTVAEGEGEEQVQQADETASKNEEEESKIVNGGGD